MDDMRKFACLENGFEQARFADVGFDKFVCGVGVMVGDVRPFYRRGVKVVKIVDDRHFPVAFG